MLLRKVSWCRWRNDHPKNSTELPSPVPTQAANHCTMVSKNGVVEPLVANRKGCQVYVAGFSTPGASRVAGEKLHSSKDQEFWETAEVHLSGEAVFSKSDLDVQGGFPASDVANAVSDTAVRSEIITESKAVTVSQCTKSLGQICSVGTSAELQALNQS